MSRYRKNIEKKLFASKHREHDTSAFLWFGIVIAIERERDRLWNQSMGKIYGFIGSKSKKLRAKIFQRKKKKEMNQKPNRFSHLLKSRKKTPKALAQSTTFALTISIFYLLLHRSFNAQCSVSMLLWKIVVFLIARHLLFTRWNWIVCFLWESIVDCFCVCVCEWMNYWWN